MKLVLAYVSYFHFYIVKSTFFLGYLIIALAVKCVAVTFDNWTDWQFSRAVQPFYVSRLHFHFNATDTKSEFWKYLNSPSFSSTMEHDSKVVWGEGGTTLVEWKWKDLDGEDFVKMMGWLVDRNQEGCKLRLKDNAFLTQMDKTLAWRRWTASSWPPASPPSPPARRGWRPGRDWPPRRPARWCGTPAIVQLVMWSRSWLVWGQTLPEHNGPRALKSAMTHPTPLMETGIRLSMAFVPASTTLLLFNSDVNNVALVFSWRQQHGFCLLQHQQHGYWFVPMSKTWLSKLTTVG